MIVTTRYNGVPSAHQRRASIVVAAGTEDEGFDRKVLRPRDGYHRWVELTLSPGFSFQLETDGSNERVRLNGSGLLQLTVMRIRTIDKVLICCNGRFGAQYW
jgi:hypothetical protein